MSNTLTVVEELRPDFPKSWNDAARRATHQIVHRETIPSAPMVREKVSDLRKYIDDMIDEMGPNSEKEISGDRGAHHWMVFGSTAVTVGEKLGFFAGISAAPAEWTQKISGILVRKQKDYGHQNIARFGRIGLLVRCHDKIARLENLLGNDKTPENETVVDNFIDVVGYSAIGIMWERGWFLLPLED